MYTEKKKKPARRVTTEDKMIAEETRVSLKPLNHSYSETTQMIRGQDGKMVPTKLCYWCGKRKMYHTTQVTCSTGERRIIRV